MNEEMIPSFRTADIVIYPSRNRLIRSAAGCALFLVIIWFYSPQSSDYPVLTVKMWMATIIGLPLFSLALLYFIWRIVKPQPVLVADGQGLSLGGTILSPGRLAWNEIAALRICVVRKRRMLGIDLHDPEKALARMPPAVRWLTRMNRSIAGSAFYLPQAMVQCPLEDLIAALEERRTAFESHYRNAA